MFDGSVLGGRCAASSSATWWIGVAVGVPGGIATLLSLGFFFAVCRRRAGRHRLLHSVPQGEVTLVFTDIQNSTHLWETYPEMSDALEVHNFIMRELIRAYGLRVHACVCVSCFSPR